MAREISANKLSFGVITIAQHLTHPNIEDHRAIEPHARAGEVKRFAIGRDHRQQLALVRSIDFVRKLEDLLLSARAGQSYSDGYSDLSSDKENENKSAHEFTTV
jgi:hypothetical protein